MGKKFVTELVSLSVGIIFFIVVIKIAGLGNVLHAFGKFSPIYFVPFLFVSFLIFLITTYRWKAVLHGIGTEIPIMKLLKYKLIVFGPNYLTPSARLGGEPLKVVLLRSNHKMKTPKAAASVIVDNFIGMGFDAAIGGVIFIVLAFFALPIPQEIRMTFMLMGLFSLFLVTLIYYALVKKKTVFSHLIDFLAFLFGKSYKKMFVMLKMKVARTEYYMRTILKNRPKSALRAVFFAALTWPLTLIQYKLAILMIGVDASVTQLLLSIVVLSLTSMLPVPAALGVQEAGQFAAFRLFASNPYTGIALSLALRVKNVIMMLISFMLFSREGVSMFHSINKDVKKLKGIK
jgi:glycosyltransferase 2 family protein